MNVIQTLTLALAVVLLAAGQVRAQLRIVTYNTLDKPATQTDLDDLALIMDAIAQTSRNGVAKRPDIVALQEQTTFSLVDSTAARVAETLNALFGVETYESQMLGFGVDRLGVVYDTSMVSLDASSGVGTGGPRPAQRSVFTLDSYPEAEPLYLYNAHFKAGSSSSDRSTRAGEAAALRTNLSGLGPGVNAIALGDFNIGAHSESAFANLTASGSPGFSDPIALGSWPNSGVAEHMTQSTRTSFLADEGATGGLDDRFDMQLVTQTLLDGEGLSYIGPTSAGQGAAEHSYQAFGNDGVSWNTRINNSVIGRSQSADVINALHDFSDHLPVVADYQLPAIMDVLASSLPASVAVGDALSLDVTVRNAASVVAAIGADELDYQISLSGVSTDGASGSALALAAADEHSFTLDTASAGLKSGTLVVTSTSQGAANAYFELPIAYEVVAAVLAGDFNTDGIVDAADYTVWRDALGSNADLGGAGVNDGVVDQLDYVVWRDNYGASESLSQTPAPEPSGIAAAIAAALALGGGRHSLSAGSRRT